MTNIVREPTNLHLLVILLQQSVLALLLPTALQLAALCAALDLPVETATWKAEARALLATVLLVATGATLLLLQM